MPATRVDSEAIVAAIKLACRAPSLHNSQPWRWVATDESVELFADPARVVRSTDATGREALLSCGAVLDHFRVAMSAGGWHTWVRRFPDQDDPLHLATIEFAAAPVSDECRRRADAILSRRTDRLPLSAPPDWARAANTFNEPGRHNAVRVDVIADELRESVTQAARLAEESRAHDFGYQSEMYWWTAAFAVDSGIPPTSLISEDEGDRVDVGRRFPPTVRRQRRGQLDNDHSEIIALSTVDDARENVLRCGEQLSALLLDAAVAGMSTCTLTHIIEVPEARDIIASLLPRAAIPQALVRVGLAPAMDATPPPTPRRPIEHVLQIVRGTSC